MTELAIIGSDIQEVLGSATALQILFGIPLYYGVIITIFDCLLFLYIHYFGLRKLEAFFILLILVMAVSFFVNMTVSNPSASDIAYGAIVPTIPPGALTAALGLVGAVIMPHNLFLHSSLVLTRKVDGTDKRAVNDANMYYMIESSITLFISFLINMSVIATFAAYS